MAAFFRLLNLHLVFALLGANSAGQSFYDLLNVGRDADLLEIRRSFKKLAIKFHPDKNKGDPEAHEKFVGLNRAYEVLKDQELRKKYDQLGEEGLAADASSPFGRNYQSWRFYKEQFGIYDDDPEVVTLTGAEFESLVLNGGRRWFVNFYSAHCSHCHHLAPEWRKMAREVEGAFRIGAVNCLDDFELCSKERIHGYPSLILYPERLRYDGPRDADSLAEFVLGRADRRPWTEFKRQTFKSLAAEREPESWLVEFLDEPTRRLSERCKTVLSASFDNLVNAAFVDCRAEADWCRSLGFHSQLVYFQSIEKLQEAAGVKIDSLSCREISSRLLDSLPDFRELSSAALDDILSAREAEFAPWLVEFRSDDRASGDKQLRKLPTLLGRSGGVKFGRVDCSESADVCQKLRINKFPTFVLFKGAGTFEFHYGRNSVFDLASFVESSLSTNVRSLGPEHFPHKVLGDVQPWFVDFFAPWCPPCMKLLPEFRKTARKLGAEVHFGTVDCAREGDLCARLNVRSYPTTVFYNSSDLHTLIGYHSAEEILEFFQDLKSPIVRALSPDAFEMLVTGRPAGSALVVDFYDPQCPPCRQLEPEFRKLAKAMKEYDFIRFGKVDCSAFGDFCARRDVRHYPTVRFYPADSRGYADYQNWFRDAGSMQRWLLSWLPSFIDEIQGRHFLEDVLSAGEPFLIDFFAPWCGHCHAFAPEFEKVAKALRGKAKVVKMNCDLNPGACSSAGVTGYPTVKFYGGARDGKRQSPLGKEIRGRSSREIVSLVESLLREGLETVPRDEL